MLQSMRDGAQSGVIKFILFGILAMAVMGLVFMDVSGSFRGGIPLDTVARVGPVDIGNHEFSSAVQNSMARVPMTTEQAYEVGIIDQILQNEIQSRLITLAAHDANLRIGNKDVAAQITQIIAPYTDGSINRKQALQRFLSLQGTTEEAFVNSIRLEMATDLLRSAVLSGSKPPQSLVNDLYQFQNQKRDVSVFRIRLSKMKLDIEPTDDDLSEHYQEIRHEFAIPERRLITVLTLDEGTLKDQLAITDDLIEQTYEDRIDEYYVSEQREVEQAVFDTKEQAFTAHETLKQNAEAFEKNAKGINENAYIGRDRFTKNALPAELADIVFSTEAGQIAEPVESALGWHIFKIIKVKEPYTKELAEVAEDIKTELSETILADRLFEMANSVEDMLASGMTLQDVAKELSLETKTYGPLNIEGKSPDDKDLLADVTGAADILQEAFALDINFPSTMLDISENAIAFVQTDDIIPSSYEPFEDQNVRKTVYDSYVKQQKMDLALTKAKDAKETLQNKTPLHEVAKTYGEKATTYHDMELSEDPPAGLTDQNLNDIFSVHQVGDIALSKYDDGVLIAQISEIKLPNVTGADNDRALLASNLSRTIGNQMYESYVGALQQRYEVEINRETLDAMYGPDRQLAF